MFESEKGSGSLSNLGQSKLYSPDFSLVLEAVLATDFNFLDDSFLLKRTSGSLVCARVYVSLSYGCDNSLAFILLRDL